MSAIARPGGPTRVTCLATRLGVHVGDLVVGDDWCSASGHGLEHRAERAVAIDDQELLQSQAAVRLLSLDSPASTLDAGTVATASLATGSFWIWRRRGFQA